MKERIRFVLIIACGVLAFGQSPGTFSATGNMTISRYAYTATLLANGKVLIAGGQSLGNHPSGLQSAELYDPTTGTFTRTGDMISARAYHSATLLADGKVLLAGGWDHRYSLPLASAELYDPETETFSTTGEMIAGGPATAILLAGGIVLIAHDRIAQGPVTAELYDPVAGTFSPTGDQLAIGAGHQQGALLPDGRVLLVICCTYEQVYDPATGTFSFTGRTSSINEDGFAAASLANGMVLVQGGYFEEGNVVTAGADLYDPSSGVFTPTGKMNTPRYAHTATLLCDGTVLVAGGEGNTESEFALASAEIYDPATGTFSRTGDMSAARVTHTATPLLDGTVLIAGGLSVDQRFVTSAEVYHPGSSCIGQF